MRNIEENSDEDLQVSSIVPEILTVETFEVLCRPVFSI